MPPKTENGFNERIDNGSTTVETQDTIPSSTNEENSEIFSQTELFDKTLPPESQQQQANLYGITQELLTYIKNKNSIEKNKFLQELQNNETLKRAFLIQTQEKFKTPPTPLSDQDRVDIQLYGKLFFEDKDKHIANSITIDSKDGPQTKLLVELLRDGENFSPEHFIQKISNILTLRTQNNPLATAIRNQLLQKARATINGSDVLRAEWIAHQEAYKEQPTILATQISTYLFGGANEDFVDGIYGKNTQAAARIIQGGEAKTEQERKRKRGHYHHKKLAVEHQNRRQDYLNRLPNSTVKSMKETSVLDIGRNETLTTFLQQKGETNPITYEQKVQRHKEGVIKAILPKLQGLLTEGQLSSLLDEQGNVKPTARKQLLERNIDKQYFGKIMKELYHPDYEHIQQHIREKIREATKERAKNLKAINDVLQYIKQYLNITTEGENLNFGEHFNRNPNSKDNLEIANNHIYIKGNLQDTPRVIPLSFSYDMETGILSTNSIAKQTTEHSLVLNSTQANVPLFNLGRWEELKDPNAEFKDLMEDKGDKTIGFQKQIIELNIEKNRTLSYLITTFGIDKQSAYLQNQSPGIYHLFQVVENSLRTPEECRIFREQMQRLNVLIGNKDTSTTNTTETTTENQSPPTSSEKPIEQTEKQVDLPSELQEYFSPTKRQQDIKNLGETEGTDNGLYIFLKQFTSNLDKNAPTAYNEHQRINLDAMKTKIKTMEQEQTNKQLFAQYNEITNQEHNNADEILKKRPT